MTGPQPEPEAGDGVSLLELPWARLRLRRWPSGGASSLRAFGHGEAALLLRIPAHAGPLLLCGDGFGALALGSAGRTRTLVADRATTRVALAANAALNPNLPAGPPCALTTPLEVPATAVGGERFGAVLLSWPRSHDLGFDQLRRVSAALTPGTPIEIASRAEDWSANVIRRIGATLDDAVVHRAERRGRRIEGRLRAAPTPQPIRVAGPDGLTLWSWAGVFAHGHLDVGSARLLPNLPTRPPTARILDLGCGNGVLGLVAALRQPGAHVTFCDDSALAIDAARRSWAANAERLAGRSAAFLHACDLRSVANHAIDLVVCNPPAHVEGAETRAAAAAMFADVERVLHPDGAFWLVANGHLDYPDRLRQHFARVVVVQADTRFVVVRAQGPRRQGGRDRSAQRPTSEEG